MLAPESILAWIIIGAIAGWLAGLLVKGYGFGLIGNIVVGIVGAAVAGLLASQLHLTESHSATSSPPPSGLWSSSSLLGFYDELDLRFNGNVSPSGTPCGGSPFARQVTACWRPVKSLRREISYDF